MIELTKEEEESLAELTTHAGWKPYVRLLRDLRDDIHDSFIGRSIKSQEDLIEMAKDQARLEFIENVIIPLVGDTLKKEE